MTDLQAAIARIESERAEAVKDMRHAEEETRRLSAMVQAFDVSLGEIRKALPSTEPAPAAPKPPRLDIARAVLEILSEQGPHSLDDLAKAVGRKPGQVTAATDRLGGKVYRANDGIYFLAEQRQAEAAQ